MMPTREARSLLGSLQFSWLPLSNSGWAAMMSGPGNRSVVSRPSMTVASSVHVVADVAISGSVRIGWNDVLASTAISQVR